MSDPAADDPRWATLLAGSPDDFPEDEARRLDAAEAMVKRQFGIGPQYYVRADECPGRSAKLSRIIAVLVLNRQEWEAAGSGQEGMEARKRVACSSGHKTPAGGKNLPATVIEDNQHEDCFSIRYTDPDTDEYDVIHFCDWPALKAAIDKHQRERGGKV